MKGEREACRLSQVPIDDDDVITAGYPILQSRGKFLKNLFKPLLRGISYSAHVDVPFAIYSHVASILRKRKIRLRNCLPTPLNHEWLVGRLRCERAKRPSWESGIFTTWTSYFQEQTAARANAGF